MRWMPALLLCGFLATVSAVGLQSPPSLAMQATPTPPSGPARDFCSIEEDDPLDTRVTFAPIAVPAGAVPVRDITNPYPDPAPDSGSLVMTFVTLPEHTCILGSYFYPSMIMTVTSGDISIFIEHWPGIADAPVAHIVPGGDALPLDLPIGVAAPVAAGDWVQIENESFVGFRNQTDDDATFVVAGLKADGEPGGGGCGGGCRHHP